MWKHNSILQETSPDKIQSYNVSPSTIKTTQLTQWMRLNTIGVLSLTWSLPGCPSSSSHGVNQVLKENTVGTNKPYISSAKLVRTTSPLPSPFSHLCKVVLKPHIPDYYLHLQVSWVWISESANTLQVCFLIMRLMAPQHQRSLAYKAQPWHQLQMVVSIRVAKECMDLQELHWWQHRQFLLEVENHKVCYKLQLLQQHWYQQQNQDARFSGTFPLVSW